MTGTDRASQSTSVFRSRWSGWTVAAFLAVAFTLRLAFGLCSEFWLDDEQQIYLIGLKYYTTGAWPYLGPDVVYTRTQVPGALQGVLIAAPLWVAPYPEAPFVLLNLLSLAALSLLAWYIGLRLPDVPGWLLWPLIFFLPWTINFSTHVTNPSYVLPGAVLFFVGIFELVPFLTIRAMPRRQAFFLAGFGLLWIAQLHMSSLLLLPFVVLVLAYAAAEGWRSSADALIWFLAGAVTSGATLIPTLLTYGLGAGGAGRNITIEPGNLLRALEVVARFFSFASFELPRFIGPNTATRLDFLGNHLWAAPFAVFLGVCGLIQPFILLACLFWKTTTPRTWPGVRGMTIGTLALVYLSFVFSVKDPASHTFYVILPVVVIYSVYCWRPLLQTRAGRAVGAALIISSLVTHTAIAVDGFSRRSLYRDRSLVARAIREKDYRLLGERRPVFWEADRSATGSR